MLVPPIQAQLSRTLHWIGHSQKSIPSASVIFVVVEPTGPEEELEKLAQDHVRANPIRVETLHRANRTVARVDATINVEMELSDNQTEN